jgi:AbiV family abortive infection protein
MSEGGQKEKIGPTGIAVVQSAVDYGGALYSEATAVDFNSAFDHIVELLDDAAVLFERSSFNTAAFLAITAIEETAKAHVGLFRRGGDGIKRKGRDPLRDHKMKHQMGALPTVFMGARLTTALGKDVCVRLEKESQTDGFIATREASLYCARLGDRFVTPRSVVTKARAWELLLMAIETLDDGLVGYSSHTMAGCSRIDALFDRVARTLQDE